MSFCVLDCMGRGYYPLPAGLHCQSAFDRAGTKGAQQRFISFCAYS